MSTTTLPAVSVLRILEPSGDGHRFLYVRLIIEAANELGISPELWTRSAAVELREFDTHISGLVFTLRSEERTPKELLGELLALGDSETIAIPDADRLLGTLYTRSRQSRNRINALVMRPDPAPGIGGFVRYAAKRALTDRLARRENVSIARLGLGVGTPGSRRAVHPIEVADPVSFRPVSASTAAARLALDLPDSRPVNLVAGGLSTRKNVPSVVRAWCSSPPGTSVLALIGTPDQATREAVASVPRGHSPFLRYQPEYVSDSLLDTWVLAADRVLVLHENVGSSGILLKAWAAGSTPVIREADPLLQSARGLGMRPATVSANDQSSLARVLGSLDRTRVLPADPDVLAARRRAFVSTMIYGDSSGGRSIK